MAPGCVLGGPRRSLEVRGSPELQNGGLRALEEAWDDFLLEAFPGHLALLERVLEVLAGTAPSFSQLCGVFLGIVGKILARPGAPFQRFLGIFWVCVYFCHTKD